MATIEGLVFCKLCGNLLPPSKGNTKNYLKCDACGTESRDIAPSTFTTESKPSDFPSLLRQKLQSNIQTVEGHKIQTMAITETKCDKCGREEVRYTTLQLRGADEGTTVFFYCDCGHTWSQNN